MKIDFVQRAILENQIILAEALWMVVRNAGGARPGAMDQVSVRIAETRKLLDEYDDLKKLRHTRKRMLDIDVIVRIKDALGTDEDGEALIEVARNAHRAEMALLGTNEEDFLAAQMKGKKEEE
jgi:hypothetical protein